MSARNAVKQALVNLSVEGRERLGSASPLFRSWCSASTVAERAGVSVTTARKHLDHLARFRGFAKIRFAGGTFGYRATDE